MLRLGLQERDPKTRLLIAAESVHCEAHERNLSQGHTGPERARQCFTTTSVSAYVDIAVCLRSGESPTFRSNQQHYYLAPFVYNSIPKPLYAC